jgi:hypothetical protein
MPVALAIVALTAVLRLTLNVSSVSNLESPLTATVMVFVVSPTLKVTLPVAAA